MAILSTFILPYPPVLRPEVGRGKEHKIKKTAQPIASEQQVAIARQKAGIRLDEAFTPERFEGVRHL